MPSRSMVVEPESFSVLKATYVAACRDLGINPCESGPAAERPAREALARAVLDAGQHETDPVRLKIKALNECCSDARFRALCS